MVQFLMMLIIRIKSLVVTASMQQLMCKSYSKATIDVNLPVDGIRSIGVTY